jgi:Kef-type K+ transport system membrane component KefB
MNAESFVHGDPIAPVILGVTSILAFAIVGRVGARKLGQPTVLGELIMGILLGNIAWYFGVDLIAVLREGPHVFELVHETLAGASVDEAAVHIFGVERGAEIARIITGPQGGQIIQVAETVDVFSRYGIIFLLFMVGLETTIEELESVGGDSIRVALIGVIAPVALGFGVVSWLRPDIALDASLFIAATLAATSIGITADVLHEGGKNKSEAGRIILGAAVCDDVLGLILLAAVSAIIVHGSVDLGEIIMLVVISTLFLVATAVLGPRMVRYAAHLMRGLDIVEAKMFTSFLFVMLLAWVASLAGLATIIGAFAAGIVMRDRFFRENGEPAMNGEVRVRELIMPLEVIFVPIFFILMGIQVKLESFMSWPVVILAAGLIVVAIVGKVVSGFGAHRSAGRMLVGVGMLPRGEVGLVFAAIGRSLGVIDDAMFSAIVLMVIVTTLIAPEWLAFLIDREGRRLR